MTAQLDERAYPTGETVTDEQMNALSLHRHEFHGDWNYELHPRGQEHRVCCSNSSEALTAKLAT